MLGAPIVGIPGLRPAATTAPRTVFRSGTTATFIAGGRSINGVLSRDPTHSGNTDVLRAGLLMGRQTSSKQYAPSIIGRTNAAYTSGGTTLTLTAATVTELRRRIGESGTFTLVGPPTANGVVATATVTYSALPTATTAAITALAANYISGSLVMPTDGSQTPLTFIPDGTGIKVTDHSGKDVAQVPFPLVPIAAEITIANIIEYPSNAKIAEWLKAQLKTGGNWIFDDEW